MDKWPYTTLPSNGYTCVICNRQIGYNESNGKYFPASLYWNVEYKRVFCSAQHSLDYHQGTWR
jgi:hypothetical protein